MATVGRTVKETVVAEVTNRLRERSSFIVANVSRLPAAETDTLRKQLRAADARLLVLSHRLGARSMAALKLTGVEALFEGSLGVVLPSEDVASTAKVVVDFSKGHEAQIVIRGALLDGEVVTRQRVEELAGLPPKPVLRAQVLAAIEGPIAQLIGLVEQLIGDVAWVTEQAAAKAPKPAAPAEAPASPGPSEGPQAGTGGAPPATPEPPDAPQAQGGSS
jgi:large subunit ribosomal protein L10